ncbi:YbjN domain-containing protein [Xylophilus rhododendri]|uniref:YbjN domain-containing protein n=1 Tax=Xylophilus rhododendri TaxID=2697032 RepID=A0A857J1E0_9BURK|nr:YbjN domain-containing protein [Xylophilus rhododendri]QHI97397.1 YbjN domain-containing protein [Xylophilus rhododendri]
MTETLATPTAASALASDTLLQYLTAETASDAIKAAGCAVTPVEQDGVTRLHSASHGIGFQVLWGNAVAPGQYADLTLSCPLRIEGGVLPASVFADWHRARRFARVSQHGDFVVLEMDLPVTGGVAFAHVAWMMRLWTQVMGEFFLHLRNYRSSPEAAAPQAPAAD